LNPEPHTHRDAVKTSRNAVPVAAPQLVPIAINEKQLAAITGLTTSIIGAMRRDGRLGVEPIRRAGRFLYDYADVVAWWKAGAPPRSEWTARKNTNAVAERLAGLAKKAGCPTT
jgi:hypothetical protein